jgi:hypothetical protein
MQAIFENVFLHASPESTIKVVIHPYLKEMVITNEIDKKRDAERSSHIGLKIISRLSEKIQYEFNTHATESTFTTVIKFQT